MTIQKFTRLEDLPNVSVLMAVYNAEDVIGEKVESILNSDYPKEKLNIFIGSDNSSDRSDEIIAKIASENDHLHFFPFKDRRGKSGVINELALTASKRWPISDQHIFLITDATVILTPPTLKNLVRNYKNERVAIVDAHMVHTGMKAKGISQAENQYISSEVKVKYLEGLLWGKMIGPFGGCYAVRSTFFTEVPSHFLVDDFYIAMRVFERGGDAINDLEAICYEGVSHKVNEEYRRKSRISAGNFQNLTTFPHLWWPPLKPLQFAFFSHKVIRWFGPFLIILIWGTSMILGLTGSWLYWYAFLMLNLFIIGLPLLDRLLNMFNINIFLLRGVRYFLMMNIALLEGFLKFMRGVKSGAWEPVKRLKT